MKVPGLPKYEKKGKILKCAKCAKSKAYNYSVYNDKEEDKDKEETKLKGANKSSLNDNKINFDAVILDGKSANIDAHSILSVEHEVYTIKQMKQVLTTFDDKRLICRDNPLLLLLFKSLIDIFPSHKNLLTNSADNI